MTATLGELAALVGAELHGDPNLVVTGAETLLHARSGEITFAINADLAAPLARSQATAAVVPPGFEPTGIAYLTISDVTAAFEQIVGLFRPARAAAVRRIHPLAVISPSATLSEDVAIDACAIIGDDVVIGRGTTIHAGVRVMAGTRIGEETTIFPNVTLYEHTRVGNRVVLHSGVVLGAYGFGYRPIAGKHERGSQLGYVEVEDDVEIGANTTIDRGTYGATRIGAGSKIDNLTQIGHNVRIGKHNLLCAQVGIAGSTITGDYVVVGGQAGLRDHIVVGDQVTIAAASAVKGDVQAGLRIVGVPAVPEREFGAQLSGINKLAEMRKQLKALQEQVNRLEQQIGGPPTQEKAA